MPIKLIQQPTVVEAAGNIPKRIEEFVGVVNSETTALSIAKMTSPAGWQEPGQTPDEGAGRRSASGRATGRVHGRL